MACSAGMLVLIRPMSVILRDRRRGLRTSLRRAWLAAPHCLRPASYAAARAVHSVVDGAIDDHVTAAPPARREGGRVFRAATSLSADQLRRIRPARSACDVPRAPRMAA